MIEVSRRPRSGCAIARPLAASHANRTNFRPKARRQSPTHLERAVWIPTKFSPANMAHPDDRLQEARSPERGSLEISPTHGRTGKNTSVPDSGLRVLRGNRCDACSPVLVDRGQNRSGPVSSRKLRSRIRGDLVNMTPRRPCLAEFLGHGTNPLTDSL